VKEPEHWLRPKPALLGRQVRLGEYCFVHPYLKATSSVAKLIMIEKVLTAKKPLQAYPTGSAETRFGLEVDQDAC